LCLGTAPYNFSLTASDQDEIESSATDNETGKILLAKIEDSVTIIGGGTGGTAWASASPQGGWPPTF